MTKITRLVIDGFKSFGKFTELEFGDRFNVILGPNGSGKSTRGDTEILLSNGETGRIDNIVETALKNSENKVGLDDGVLTFENKKNLKILSINPVTMKIEEKKVNAFIRRDGESHLFKITTRSGRSVVTTGCHPVMIFRGEKIISEVVKNLNKGMRIATPNKIKINSNCKFFNMPQYIKYTKEADKYIIQEQKHQLKIPEFITPEFARFLGYLVGDGYIAINQRVEFVNADTELIEDFVNICKNIGGSLREYKYKNQGKARRINLFSNRLTKVLIHFFENNYKKELKHIPKEILFGDETILSNFLAALFDCDASLRKNNPTFEYVTMSETLANQVQLALLRYGILSTKKAKLKCATNTKDKVKKIYHHIFVEGKENLKKLHNYIHLRCVHKKDLLEKYANSKVKINPNTDLLPQEVNKIVKDCAIALRIHYKPLRRKHPKLAAYVENRCNPTKQGLREILNIFIHKLNRMNCFSSPSSLSQNNLLYSLREINIPFTEASKSIGLHEDTISTHWVSGKFEARQVNMIKLDQFLKKQLFARMSIAIRKMNILRNLIFSDIYWDEIVSIEKVAGEKYVYDLSIEETHNFIANNIFVHNSNVLDSLCFVLGKSSSKSLRAEKSANLIYNGGKTKQPSKIAEVSIYFDNKNKTFPVQEEEIKITRLVRHDGLSKYKINGKTKTRQEMLELLSAAKIDPDGYNIILQGDIIRMIEMSSIERRQVIEEIAGISIYEEKKQQAINELTKVDLKIGEAEIVLKERETYLKELKKDRDHALKYKELTDSLKKNKASYAKKRFDLKTEDLNKLVQKSSEFKDRLNKINEGIKNLREQITAKKEEINKINEEIESKGEVEQVKLQKHVESLKVEIATAKTKISSSQKEIEKIEHRKNQDKKSLEEVEQKIKEFEMQKKSFEETKQNQQNELEQLEKTIKEFKIKHGIETSNQIEHEIDKIDRESEEFQKNIHTLREEHQNQLREKDKNEFQLQTIEQRIEKVLELEKEHKKEIDLLKKMKNEFKKTVLELNELLNQDSLKARELGQKRDSLMVKREELSKMEVKHANMKESIHANIAVQKILERKVGLGEVYGTVSELGSVSSKYSLSLEIAAGHKIHSIVVEDDKTAAKCIKYLKENKFGVATFLPINKVKTFPQTQEATKLAGEKGVHGFATDLVKYDKKFKNIFSYVFGNTLVVDNIDTSRKLGIGSVRTVTLDGDLAEPSGAMIGGYRHKNFGSFKDNEIEEKIEKSREEINSLESEITKVEEWRKESEEKITRLREIKAGLEGDIIKTEKSLHLDSGDLIASQQYKEELEENLRKNNSALAELDSKLNELTEKVVQLKIKRQELRNKATELRKPTILAQLNAFDEKRKELSESVIKMDAELKNIDVQSNEVGYKERDSVLGSITGLDKEKKNFESEMEVLSGEIKTKEKELKQKEEDQKEFYAEYKSLFDKRNKAQDFINSCESKVLVQEEKSRNEELQINTFSIEEARVKAEIAGIEVEISQYPGVEIDLEKSEEEFKKIIASQERSLSAIGNVNMRALEIYEVTEKEYNGLIEKKDSLKVEKEEVLKLMSEIEGSKKDLFMNSLNVINENFKRIFLDLSNKGDAFLEVENPEKLFEEGIRIKVKLAGEKFLDIRSLSGGEKTMTALAFLFAIQEHEPASFYVLDEVDAALDKHNSQLLANLIRKYCHKAQYIVISHNDAVISEADILYGVSMKKDVGISQVVSLAMEEAREKIQSIRAEEVAVG